MRGAAFAAYLNCGQVCTSAERFYAHEKIHDEFADRLAAEAKKLRIGNGLNQVDMGPLATRKQTRTGLKGLLANAPAGKAPRPWPAAADRPISIAAGS